jgi:uncharacterized protein
MTATEKKLVHLKEIIAGCGSALVAYSGGVDSTFLAAVAKEVLGDRLLAVTAGSQTYPAHETAGALKLAKLLQLNHRTVFTSELDNEEFAANPPERCYICKKELFGKLAAMADEAGLACVLDGANFDDLADFRPGTRAGRELGVRSPLQEAGLSKDEIRQLSRRMGLPTWNKPSFACLSSRFPYGERITREKLAMVHEAEDYLRSQGFGQLRVRHHGSLARIEVAPAELPKAVALASEISRRLKETGYKYVTLDLQGYRTGSMNEVLDQAILASDN